MGEGVKVCSAVELVQWEGNCLHQCEERGVGSPRLRGEAEERPPGNSAESNPGRKPSFPTNSTPTRESRLGGTSPA